MFSKLWSFLDGKKLYIGGIAMMLTGIGEIAANYANGMPFSHEGWEKVVAGWLAIGAKSALAKTQNPQGGVPQ